MAVNNSLAQRSKKTAIGVYLNQESVKKRINEVVGGKDGQRLVTSIVSATTANPTLQECSNSSILAAALVGEGLKLSPSPQLGHYYFVPYNDKRLGKVAQFQLGYKGYIQLAIRSGQYKKITVLSIKKGELEYFDPLNEEIKINLMVDNWDDRDEAETVGYYAMFELVNGFRKAIYWSQKKMERHAQKYSQGYAADKRKGTSYTFWSKDFEGMAYKTMLRQLISKWGIMSVEMQAAFDSDMAVINEDGTKEYVDIEVEDAVVFEQPSEEITEDSEVIEAEIVEDQQGDVQQALFG